MALRWGLIAGCWLAWGLFYASRLRLVIPGTTWGKALEYALPDAVLWALLTPIPIALARRFPVRFDRLVPALTVHVVAAVTVAIVHSVLEAGLNVLVISPPDRSSTFQAMLAHLGRYALHPNLMLYFVIVGVSQYLTHNRRLRERERQATELRAQLTEARLDALQMQLRPHFLFNALNTISGLVERDVAAGRTVLRQLGDMLRAVLQHRDSPEVRLEQELDLVRTYLEIEKARFGERLDLRLEIAAETLPLAVPTFLMQPLVENAVTHAVARRTAGGRIEIAASRDGPWLRLGVRDNGPGDAHATGSHPGQGIGLANTRARLRQLYGDEHELRVQRGDDGGWNVELAIPARPAQRAERRSA